MIWEQEASIIVMVTNPMENGVVSTKSFNSEPRIKVIPNLVNYLHFLPLRDFTMIIPTCLLVRGLTVYLITYNLLCACPFSALRVVQVKCEEYWPSSKGSLQCGNIITALESEQLFPEFIMRKFKIYNKSSSKNKSVSYTVLW